LIAAAAAAPWRVGIVSGHSMTPTLPSGGLFLYERLSAADAVGVGEIVVVMVDGRPCVKRVYATGGSAFWTLRQPVQGSIRRDPITASQRDRWEQLATHERVENQADVRVMPFRVPVGHVFLVGDGASSEDSRQFGPVDATQLVGRVVALPGQQLDPPASGVELSFPARTCRPQVALGSSSQSAPG
jgi:signal peptidase I